MNNQKLFLASSFKDVACLLPLLESNLKGKSVTFIPTASIKEKVVFYVKSGKKALEKLGLIVNELELTTASDAEIIAQLTNTDFIYITGGNSFFLLQELKRTGADVLITEAIKSGKIYIGESAGAIIVAKNIDYIKSMDTIRQAPNLNNHDALALTEFSIVPHYTNVPFKKIAQKIVENYAETLSLIPISNNEAVLISNNKIEVKRVAK